MQAALAHGGQGPRATTYGRGHAGAEAAGQPQGITGDFQTHLGVDPTQAGEGDIAAMVKAGRRRLARRSKNTPRRHEAEGSKCRRWNSCWPPPHADGPKRLAKGIRRRGRRISGRSGGDADLWPGAGNATSWRGRETRWTPPPVGEPINPIRPPGRQDIGPVASRSRFEGTGHASAARPVAVELDRGGKASFQDVGGELAAAGGCAGIEARSEKPDAYGIKRAGASRGGGGVLPGYRSSSVETGTADNYHRVTGDHLLDAIKEEVAGTRTRYGRSPDWKAQAAYDARQGAMAQNRALADEHYGKQQDATADWHAKAAEQARQDEVTAQANRELTPEEGAATEPPAPGYTGGQAPQYEPAQQTSFTGEALDRIRRRANAMVKRDDFGRPVLSGKKGVGNEENVAFAKDFSSALAGGPEGGSTAPGADLLRGALDTSSDYLGLRSAFDNFKGKLTSGSMSDFGKAWGTLKPGAERDAARGALASDVIDLWGRGQLKGGKFSVPGIQQKLELAFGKKGAQDFTAQMERRAQLAGSGQRMAPFSGSPTMSLQEAAGASNDMAPVASNLARIGGKLAAGNWLGAGADAIGGAARYVGQSAGTTQGFP